MKESGAFTQIEITFATGSWCCAGKKKRAERNRTAKVEEGKNQSVSSSLAYSINKLNFPPPAGGTVLGKCFDAMDGLRILLSVDHESPDVQATRAHIVSFILKEMYQFVAKTFIMDPVGRANYDTVMADRGEPNPNPNPNPKPNPKPKPSPSPNPNPYPTSSPNPNLNPNPNWRGTHATIGSDSSCRDRLAPVTCIWRSIMPVTV